MAELAVGKGEALGGHALRAKCRSSRTERFCVPTEFASALCHSACHCHELWSWRIARFLHSSPTSKDCAQCHQAPLSHYMEHSVVMDKMISGQERATVNQRFLCHRTDWFNDIKDFGWYKALWEESTMSSSSATSRFSRRAPRPRNSRSWDPCAPVPGMPPRSLGMGGKPQQYSVVVYGSGGRRTCVQLVDVQAVG